MTGTWTTRAAGAGLVVCACAGVAWLAGCAPPKPPTPIQQPEPVVYRATDDPLAARVAAGRLSGEAAEAARPGPPPTAVPSVHIHAIRPRAESPAGRDEAWPSGSARLGTIDDYIAARGPHGDDGTPGVPVVHSVGPAVARSDGSPQRTQGEFSSGPSVVAPAPAGLPQGTQSSQRTPAPADASPYPGQVVSPDGPRPPAQGLIDPPHPPGAAGAGPSSGPVRLVLPDAGAPQTPVPPPPTTRIEPGPRGPAAPRANRPAGILPGEPGGADPSADPAALEPAPRVQPVYELSRAALSGVALEADGRVFLVDEILRPIWGELERLAGRLSPAAYRGEAMELIATQLQSDVSEHLVLGEAERALNEQTREAVDRTLAELMREQAVKVFGGSERLMRQAYEQRGLDYQKEMDSQRRQLLVQAYLREKFLPQIHVTRPEAFDYYQRHIEQFSSEPQVHLWLIQVRPELWFPAEGMVTREQRLAAEEQAREYARRVRGQIAAGAMSFEDAARRYSQGPNAASGGDWGMIRPNSLRARQVERAAFALTGGQVSEVIEDGGTLYIARVSESTPHKVVPFADAVAAIIPRLERQKFTEQSAAYMAQLFRQANIDPQRIDRFVNEAYRLAPQPGFVPDRGQDHAPAEPDRTP